MSKPGNYHRMSIGEKQAAVRGVMREPAVVCPGCEAQTTARDLLEHMASRCPGRRDPHPGSAWISWREARSLVPKRTLVRWVEGGLVRYRGGRGDRQYLLRDIALRLAQRNKQSSSVGATGGTRRVDPIGNR